MSTCRECNHWQGIVFLSRKWDEPHPPVPVGEVYENWEVPDRIGPDNDSPLDISRDSKWGHCKREYQPGTPMFTIDASNYYSVLRTQDTFHCAAYEDAR